jgi:glycerol-3-phosphate dehydrogenase
VDTFKEERFDLLILGGGITGAGVALDATLRGFRVALIDKGDFASGTSSVSSKLVHGGLRYLEHGNFHLVYEALHERGLLLENASPFVWPLRFVIPFYRGSRMPWWKARSGLVLYDLLAGSSNLHRSRPLQAKEVQGQFPGLQTDRLQGGAEYFDAQMDDARLCLAVIRTAAPRGARIANYVEAIAFEKREGKIIGVRARDHVGKSEFIIHARQVLNATGPWVDAVCRLASLPSAEDRGSRIEDRSLPGQSSILDPQSSILDLLQPTKGVHLIVPKRDLPAALLLLHPADGRVFFIIPWMQKTLIGTTDTVTDQSPDVLTVIPAEIDYLLAGFNRYFTPPLQVTDVLGTFAGLRPLMRPVRSKWPAHSYLGPSSLSREYRIVESPTGLISVAGGKYTTYRRMAEVITDTITRRLGRRGPCKTQTFRLDSALPQPTAEALAGEIEKVRRSYSLLDDAAARHLVTRYGRRAGDAAAHACLDSKSAKRILPGEPDLTGELDYQREHEMAIYPADFWLRRTRLGLIHHGSLQMDCPS